MTMRKLKLVLISVLLSWFSIAGFAQGLEEILTKHEKAIGAGTGTINSAVISGYSYRGTTEIPYKLYMKNGKVRYEATGQNSRPMIQIFDGQKGWILSPRSPEPQELTGGQLWMIQHRANIGSPLTSWRKYIKRLSLVGTEKLEGVEVFKIRMESKEALTKYYIDKKSYLLLRQIRLIQQSGEELKMLTIYKNYKVVDGFTLAFNIETKPEGGELARGSRMGGRGGGIQLIEEVRLNVLVDDKLFQFQKQIVDPY